MSIDFFEDHCRQTTSAPLFGLCDDQNNTPAYIDVNNSQKWIARVENPNQIPVTFTAIDNCIPIFRENGDMERRCDGILTYPNNIVFVELKIIRTGGWIEDGVDQLLMTINLFTKNYDIATIKHKRAFLVNRKRPYFEHSFNEKRQQIYNQYKIRMNIEALIKIQ